MENLIKDLLERLEVQKQLSLKNVNSSDIDEIRLVDSGKVFAFDFCIGELQRVLNYQHTSDLNKQS